MLATAKTNDLEFNRQSQPYTIVQLKGLSAKKTPLGGSPTTDTTSGRVIAKVSQENTLN